jgi:TonB family protein
MDRLQKKCFVAAAGFHGLLVLILLTGSAFLASKSKTDTFPVLDFVPFKTVDALVSGGGNPNAQPAAALPAPPPKVQAVQAPPIAQPTPPSPQPEKVKAAEPVKEEIKEVKPPKPDVESLEPSKERKPKKLEISTTPIVRQRDFKSEAKARADEEARQAKRETDARRKIADRIGQAAGRIGNAISSGTSIELKGPGGGGVPYANFLQAVQTVYDRAWVVPDGVTDSSAVTAATVTIARDGAVLSARIVRSSGNRAVDRSVQAALDRVKFAAPLPDEAKEDQRTVTINFSVKAKLSLG